MSMFVYPLLFTFDYFKLVDNVAPGVTHVVAAKDGTDKAIAARRTPGCRLVKAAWLVESFWSITRRDEVLHFWRKEDANKDYSETRESRGAADNDSSSSDEDDDLAAEFEDELMQMEE